jgi:O-antigen/teichoic acid export membrane protein
LSIYKDIYSKYAEVLIILTISVVPLILKTNVITMLNNQGSLKKVVLLGIVESSIFLSAIAFLVPYVGVIGGAWAVAISSISTAILSLYWANNAIRRIFFISILVVAIGVASGLLVQQIIDSRFVVTLVGFATSIASMFLFRLIRFSEILFIINQIKSRNF